MTGDKTPNYILHTPLFIAFVELKFTTFYRDVVQQVIIAGSCAPLIFLFIISRFSFHRYFVLSGFKLFILLSFNAFINPGYKKRSHKPPQFMQSSLVLYVLRAFVVFLHQFPTRTISRKPLPPYLPPLPLSPIYPFSVL